jgi:hypothetical protein
MYENIMGYKVESVRIDNNPLLQIEGQKIIEEIVVCKDGKHISIVPVCIDGYEPYLVMREVIHV